MTKQIFTVLCAPNKTLWKLGTFYEKVIFLKQQIIFESFLIKKHLFSKKIEKRITNEASERHISSQYFLSSSYFMIYHEEPKTRVIQEFNIIFFASLVLFQTLRMTFQNSLLVFNDDKKELFCLLDLLKWSNFPKQWELFIFEDMKTKHSLWKFCIIYSDFGPLSTRTLILFSKISFHTVH